MSNLALLKTELTADPLTRGYAGMTDQQASDAINAVDRSADVESVSGQDIFEAADPTERDALSAAEKDLFAMIVGMGSVLVNGANTKQSLLNMFGAGTATRTNLAALQTKLISRGAELGIGPVHAGDVGFARI